MHFTTQSSLLPQIAVVVGCFQDEGLDPSARTLDQLSGGALTAFKERGLFKGKAGETQWFYDVAQIETSVLVVGLGKASRFNAEAYLKTLRTVGKVLAKSPFSDVAIGLTRTPIVGTLPVSSMSLWSVAQAVVQLEYAQYRFEQFKSEPAPASKLSNIVLYSQEESSVTEAVIRSAQALVSGMNMTRDAVNMPANVGTPSYLADQALSLAQRYPSIEVEVLGQEACEALGMGAFLSVTRGGPQAPKFIILKYQGAAADQAPTVLVGKGITFDTGGISLKPAVDMHQMKMDMGGAASVLGTFAALGELKPAINVVGLIPSCENMPSGTATKPGDVVKSMSGKTIEVLNTDAEGRLILADALTYAERFNPKAVIDIATLTGACIIALGTEVAALYSDDESLATALLASSQRAGDALWRMPIVDSYLESLKTGCSDLANVALGGSRSAGSIVAACFLKEFAGAYPWAHLDIAGVVIESGKDFMATGRPVGILVDYLVYKA